MQNNFKIRTHLYNRVRHEVRTQPIMTAMILAVISTGVLKCSASDADATTVVHNLNTIQDEQPIIANPIVVVEDSRPKGRESMMVDFSYMGSGSKVGPLMGSYLGMTATTDRPAILPASTTVNWGDNLQKLWDKKLTKKNVTPSTVKNAHIIVDRYLDGSRDTKSVREFVSQVDGVVKNTHQSINYASLCKDMKISNSKCDQYKTLMGRISGTNIVAYGMTEIFPAQNGKYNLVALDTILRTAGENYIDAIPALGDGLLSKGLYQFTSHAVRRDDEALGGANFVDNHAGMKLPGSVLYLTGNDNHKAAFEFAAYNLGMLVRKLDDKQTVTLVNKCSIEQITEVIATAHHLPARAVSNAKKWVKDGCRKPYRSYTGKRLETYALKTSVNYKALEAFL